MEDFSIRKAKVTDLSELLNLYENARKFMKEQGNESQWGLPTKGNKPWPSKESLISRINAGTQFICEVKNISQIKTDFQTKIAASFCYVIGKEPVYDTLYDGKWPDTHSNYGVIHILASSQIAHGAASFCLNWALQQCVQLRIDTHPNNKPMQSLLKKNGFTYCGKIYMEDVQNDDKIRIAYCKILQKN